MAITSSNTKLNGTASAGNTTVKGLANESDQTLNGSTGSVIGTGIARMEQTAVSHESGGKNTWTAYLTNDTSYSFDVMNGEQGDAFTYDDFTPEQLAALTGPKGDTGATGPAGNGIASTVLNADYTLTITFTDGTTYTTPSIRGERGAKGDTGATGETGNGIESSELNDDYTLTLDFTDGTSYTTPSIRGAQGTTGATGATGNGIASTVLNADYTLTITFTDGTTYTTPSIRGEQGATGPAGATGNGIDSAELNADYTLTLDFTDGTSYTTPSIRGAQGATGSTGPTGAAAGFGTPTASISGGTGTPAVSVTASGPDTAKVFNFAFSNLKGATGETGPQGPQGEPQDDYTFVKVIGDKTVTGNPIEVDDVVVTTPSALSASIEPIQSGSGTPSQDNVRPISGSTEVNVTRCGKNLFDFEGWLQANNISYTKSGNSFIFLPTADLFGIPCVFSDTDIATNFLGTVTIPEGSSASAVGFELLDANDTTVGSRTSSWSNKTGCKIRLNWSTRGIITVEAPILTTADKSVTPYEEFTRQSVTFLLGDTIYGGTLDVLTGVLTVDKGYAKVSDLTWTYNSNYQRFGAIITGIKTPPNNNTLAEFAISSHFNLATANNTANSGYNGYFGVSTSETVYVRAEAYTDASSFATAFADAEFCYKLASPTTVQLTAEQIELLEGYNVLTTDADSLTMTYLSPNISA